MSGVMEVDLQEYVAGGYWVVRQSQRAQWCDDRYVADPIVSCSCCLLRSAAGPCGSNDADFDYVAGRGPWISAERWQYVERFKFYARHVWQPGLWRWPLRAASRWRCDRDWYSFPVEKTLVEWVRPPQQVS